MDRLKFMIKFPYLIEFGTGKFIGFIHLKDESVGIQLNCPEFPSTTSAILSVTRNNQVAEYCVENNCSDVFALMNTIEAELNGCSSETTLEQDIADYKTISRQIAEIQGEYSCKLSQDYKTLTIPRIVDHPSHNLEFQYETRRKTFQLKKHSLPNRCQPVLKGGTLSEILSSFKATLSNLEEFYGSLSDIDELCFVIAPVPVTTKDMYRIFKFNEKVFLKITLDPFIPSSVQLNFIGPLEEVEPLREIYIQKMDDWDVEVSAHKNLLRMFDLLYFPYRPDCNSNLAENKTCAICFEFNLDNTYPVVSCFNANCEVTFHPSCLRKWFDTLTDTKTFCTITSGLCPYCKQKLTMYTDICEATTTGESSTANASS